MNGLSHVRKFIRNLSPELLEMTSSEISSAIQVMNKRLQSQEVMNNKTVKDLTEQKLQYLTVMNDLVGKEMFMKIS